MNTGPREGERLALPLKVEPTSSLSLATSLYHIEKRDYPIDPVAVAEAMGIGVKHVSLTPGVWGLYLATEKREYIVANSEHDPAEERFTYAHELGHVMLGKLGMKIGTPDLRARNRGREERIERRCDRFARNLLMPEQMVKRAVARGEGVEQIASRFGVPDYAATMRLREIARGRRKEQQQ